MRLVLEKEPGLGLQGPLGPGKIPDLSPEAWGQPTPQALGRTLAGSVWT